MTGRGSTRAKPRALFVYGTLREGGGAAVPAREVLEEAGEKVGEGVMTARLYDAGGFPGAVPDPSGRVHGEIYELGDPARIFSVLDGYEGCRPDGSGLFRREVVTVQLAGGEERRAWTYLYNREVADLPEIPSGDYLAYLEEG